MRKHIVILCPALIVAGCILGSSPSSDTGPLHPVVSSDPPGLQDDASPLALLMRRMADHADSVKSRLALGRELPPPPVGVDSLFTATPTAGMHIDAITYPTFGRDYLLKLDALQHAPTTERRAAYNALVQSCANCHTTHCPGPLMRIHKMYAEADQ